MNKNMFFADRVLRAIIAAVITVLYFAKVFPGTIGLWLMIVAVVFAITSFTGYCPIYGLFGINKKKYA